MQNLDTGKSSSGAHRLDSLIWCERQFGFSEMAKLVPVVPNRAAALGTAVHQGLAAYRLGLPWESAYEWVTDPETGIPIPPDWSFKAREAAKLVEAYIKRWAADRWITLGVEIELRVDIDGHLFTRKIDWLVQDPQNKLVYGIDAKTAGRPAQRIKTVHTEFTLYSQDIVGAVVVPQTYGAQWGGVILDLIGTGSKEPEFRRTTLAFPQQVIADGVRLLKHYLPRADQIVRSGANPWELTPSHHCQRPWGWCDYRELCLHGPEMLTRYKTEVR